MAADREIQEAQLQLRSTQRQEESTENRLVNAHAVSPAVMVQQQRFAKKMPLRFVMSGYISYCFDARLIASLLLFFATQLLFSIVFLAP